MPIARTAKAARTAMSTAGTAGFFAAGSGDGAFGASGGLASAAGCGWLWIILVKSLGPESAGKSGAGGWLEGVWNTPVAPLDRASEEGGPGERKRRVYSPGLAAGGSGAGTGDLGASKGVDRIEGWKNWVNSPGALLAAGGGAMGDGAGRAGAPPDTGA